MNSKQKLKQLNFTKCLVFILVIFCFVGIPAFILSYAVYRYNQIDESQLVLKLKSESQKLASELRQNISSEIYFCRLLHEFYIKESNNNESNYQNAINLYFDLKKNYGDYIDFIVVDNSGNVKFNSNTKKYNYTKKEWFNAYHYARRRTGYFYMLTDKNGRDLSEGELKDIRKILGPQFVEGTLGTILDHKRRSLYWCDSSKKNPPSGIYPLKWGGFFIFFSEKLLSSFMHLKNIAFDFAKNKSITTGLYKYDDINTNFESCKDILFIDEVKKALKDNQNTNKDYLETENYYISYLFLTNDIYAFVLINKENNNNQLLYKTLFVFLLYFAISFSIIKYCWNTIVLRQPGTASIRIKLAFLFMFASGIPLLTLAIIEKEFEIYKRLTLIEEARLWSVENLLGIEQRYLSYLKNMCNILDNYVEKWSNNLKGREITINDVKEIKKLEKKYNINDFYCIASDSQYIATLEGLFKYTGSLESIKFDESKSKKLQGLRDYRYNEIRTINIIVKKICSDLNGVELPSYILSKLELIAENVIQKSFPEIIYTIVDTLGSIKEWGFSNKSNLTYFRFISLYKKSITDYIIFLSWTPYDMQNAFLRDILNKANRNPNNFVFISYDNYDNKVNIDKYSGNKDIETFASRATEKPTEEIETIKYNNEEYIAVSFKSRNLSQYNFIGLYPMRNIDNQIKKQSFIFNLLGILCFILSIGLAHLLTKSFVAPLLNLQEGALAIENRNFKHRLTNLNIDEFGEVGGIFNHVMVGLEELEIAKIVQESMFPKPEFQQGKFSIYGKSVTMIDVGGDYLDFFKVDDSSFSVLVGDVAGHGVGAAVIMAMAKAAILGADEALRSPAMILNSLHKMILATKNAKQKKIMTFQYLYINSETGENLYGNAGACSPWLIRHSENSVTEIKMAGAALGAFKRAVYKEMPLDIKPGDAIVFYTDGIVECKDKNGEMLGYERLKKLLLKNWNSNPETYYNNIYNAYLNYIGVDAKAEDDLTIIILMYNKD